MTTPLWQGVVSPADQVWKTLKSEIQNNREDAESWDYWILWYEGRLRGSKPNWNLYKQISLIESPTWQAGPEVLAREIKFLEQPNHGTGTIYQVGQLSEIAEQLKVSEEKAGRLSVTLEGQEIALAKVAEESQGLADSLGKLENDSKTRFKRLTDIYQQKFETALSVFNEQQAVKAPVELWKAKQDEHDKKSTTAFRWFLAGLAAVAGSAALILFFVFSGADWVAQVLAPIGCDAVNNPELCKGFSFRGLLVTGTVLTILTLLLWLTRLRMKEYLSERHLALDARERQAFVQTYLGLVAEGDVSEEAKEQRALVYSALFRPSTDGIVKEDGGLDPSIAAAISKLLSK